MFADPLFRRSRSFLSLIGRARAVTLGLLWIGAAWFSAAGVGEQTGGAASGLTAGQRQFFEARIRPVLVKHCYECHAAGAADLGGGLALDHPGGLRKGGQSGPAISPEAPQESLLLDALRYDGLEMPPEAPLPRSVVGDFESWLEMGAPDPRDEPVADNAETGDPTASHWAFRPIADPPTPAVRQEAWPLDPLDRFVLQRLEDAGLSPTRDADPRVLFRRLHYDLLGLPPTPERLPRFLRDHARRGHGAIADLVDELLASPSFGERWARHWLDVARYGESNGNDGLSRNPTFPHAWRYRDYVIDAFNRDLAYDRFLTEQIAGDRLAAETASERDRQKIATGFLALGAKPAKAMNSNFAMDVVNDQIDVVGTAIMGLSVACARCHDHKHDPIPIRDYYALAGLFVSTETMWGAAANEKLTAPATPLHELESADPAPHADGDAEAATALAMGVRDREQVTNCKIHIQGESGKLGPEVARGFLSAWEQPGRPQIPPDVSGRLQLARWLTQPEHPLTARVMANRVWLQLFGQAIVSTPDDFGIYGTAPSHPELLDHLAVRFRQQGWSIKRLIRTIVLSRTYQLSSWGKPELWEADPDNRLYGRHLRRRLDAEALRDSVLAASGTLDRAPGMGSDVAHLDVLVNKHDSLHRPSRHRSIYLCMLRNSPPPDLAAFDLPDAIRPQGLRDETVLPTQSLFLLNNPLLVEQSRRFAERVIAEAGAGTDERIRWAYRRVFDREPNGREYGQTFALVRASQAEFSRAAETSLSPEVLVWAVVCQALLASNEFRYID